MRPTSPFPLLLLVFLVGCQPEPEKPNNDLKDAQVINQSLREELEDLKGERPPSVEGVDSRLGDLEDELNVINSENEALRREFEAFKKEYPLR